MCIRGNDMEILAKRVKWLRERERLAQKEVAAHIGLSYSGYSKIEYNERDPKLDVLIKIANLFEVSTDFLLGLDSLLPELKIYKSKAEITFNDMKKAQSKTIMLQHEVAKLEHDKHKFKELEELGEDVSDRIRKINDLLDYSKHHLDESHKIFIENQGEYSSNIIHYVKETFQIPFFNPHKDDLLKNLIPLEVKLQHDLFDEEYIELFNPSVGRIGMIKDVSFVGKDVSLKDACEMIRKKFTCEIEINM